MGLWLTSKTNLRSSCYLTFAAVTACCETGVFARTATNEAVFLPENVYEHFVFESLGAEVHSTGVGFVEENVHDPCCQECHPPDGDHHPNLVLCQIMGEAIDINQPHVGGQILQGCYGKPEPSKY